tara:strand:- start:13054 stop:14349 length:1296 start_codon:yes stop_codon:yes gene_type:complete
MAGARFDFTRIDPLTYIYSVQLVMASFGSYLIAANLVENDWVNYLSSSDPVRLIGWVLVQYGFLGCSIGLYLGVKSFNQRHKSSTFLTSLTRKSIPKSSHFITWVLLFGLCTMSALHVFHSLGGIPQLSILSSSGNALAVLRSNTKLNFSGVTFIRDFGFVACVQVLAYYAYSLKLQHPKTLRFRTLYWLSLPMAVLALTLNLEKGPIVIFFFSLLTIRFFHGRRTSIVALGFILILLMGLLVGTYIVALGTDRTALSLAQEIIGRILIAQVAGVFMTLSIFPAEYEFVLFSGIGVLTDAFGGVQSDGSARIVMQHFRPKEVELGLLGYMSSYFIAEAYGNFGALGVLFSPFIVGAVTAFIFTILRRFHNANLAIATITYVAFNLPYTSNFVAFYYSPGIWILLLILIVLGNMRLITRYTDKSTLLSDTKA